MGLEATRADVGGLAWLKQRQEELVTEGNERRREAARVVALARQHLARSGSKGPAADEHSPVADRPPVCAEAEASNPPAGVAERSPRPEQAREADAHSPCSACTGCRLRERENERLVLRLQYLEQETPQAEGAGGDEYAQAADAMRRVVEERDEAAQELRRARLEAAQSLALVMHAERRREQTEQELRQEKERSASSLHFYEAEQARLKGREAELLQQLSALTLKHKSEVDFFALHLREAREGGQEIKNEEIVTKLEQEFANCKAALASSEDNLKVYTDRLQSCEREISSKKSELDESGSILVDRLMQTVLLQQQLDACSEQLDKSEHEAAALKSQLASAEEEMCRVRWDAKTSRDELGRVEKASQEETAALKSQLASAEEEVDRMRRDAGASRDDRGRLEEDLKVAREEAAALKSQLASAEQSLAQLPGMQKELVTVRMELLQRIEKEFTVRLQVDQLEQESSFSQQELTQIRYEIEACLQHVQTERIQHQREIEGVLAETETMIKSSKEISAQLDASKQDYSALVDQLHTCLAEKNALRNELRSLALELKDLNSQLATAREEVFVEKVNREEEYGKMKIRERELQRAHERTCESLKRSAEDEHERVIAKMTQLEQQVEHLSLKLEREQSTFDAERQRSEYCLSNLREEIDEQRKKMELEMSRLQQQLEDESNAILDTLQVCPAARSRSFSERCFHQLQAPLSWITKMCWLSRIDYSWRKMLKQACERK
jgi:chromosome segregation ATPase